MIHATHCKFCKNPISVEVDDDYAKLGDPYKLLQKSCCDHCSDVRELKRLLEERVSRSAMAYAVLHKHSDEVKAKARKNLTALLKAYANLIARWHRKEGMLFDAAVVDDLMQRPDKWAAVLSGLWKMFRQWERDQESELKL